MLTIGMRIFTTASGYILQLPDRTRLPADFVAVAQRVLDGGLPAFLRHRTAVEALMEAEHRDEAPLQLLQLIGPQLEFAVSAVAMRNHIRLSNNDEFELPKLAEVVEEEGAGQNEVRCALSTATAPTVPPAPAVPSAPPAPAILTPPPPAPPPPAPLAPSLLAPPPPPAPPPLAPPAAPPAPAPAAATPPLRPAPKPVATPPPSLQPVATTTTAATAAGEAAVPAAGAPAEPPQTIEQKELMQWLKNAGLGEATKAVRQAGVDDLIGLANLSLHELHELGMEPAVKHKLWNRLQRLELVPQTRDRAAAHTDQFD